MTDKIMTDNDLKDLLEKRKDAIEFLRITNIVILTHCLKENKPQYIHHDIKKVVNYDKLNEDLLK